MKPQYSMVIQWSAEDDCYVVYPRDFSDHFMQDECGCDGGNSRYGRLSKG